MQGQAKQKAKGNAKQPVFYCLPGRGKQKKVAKRLKTTAAANT